MPNKRSAVVTGCGQGLGRAILETLIEDGWVVVGLEIDTELAADAQSAVEDSGSVIVGDASDYATLLQTAEAATRLAPLAGWVNNAGIIINGNLHAPVPEEVDRLMSLNLMGYYWGCSAAVQTFVEQRSGGAIVNVSSIHARFAFPGFAAYDTAKGGVEALTRYIAVEYGPINIRANCVAPGAIRTPLFEWLKNQSEDPDKVETDNSLLHPMERLGEPDEIATTVSFLLSANASFISGQTLGVDGGASARAHRYDPDPSLLEKYPHAAYWATHYARGN